MNKPTATVWSLPEMLDNLIYVREGRKVLGRTLLGTTDFKGLTEASRMLVDEDKEVAVSKLWLQDPRRITVDNAKDAWALRENMADCLPWINGVERVDDEDGL